MSVLKCVCNTDTQIHTFTLLINFPLGKFPIKSCHFDVNFYNQKNYINDYCVNMKFKINVLSFKCPR